MADLKEFTELPGLIFTHPLTIDFESVVGIPPTTMPLGDYCPAGPKPVEVAERAGSSGIPL